MKVNVKMDTIIPFIKALHLKDEQAMRAVLNHPDYQQELAYYNTQLTTDMFIDFMLNIDDETHESIFDKRKAYLEDIIKYPNKYIEEVEKITFDTKDLNQAYDKAHQALPEHLSFESFDVVFTIGLGKGFGFFVDNGIHFDFLQIIHNIPMQTVIDGLSYEIFQAAMAKVLLKLEPDTLPLDAYFYLPFILEGLPHKYMLNGEGLYSKALHDAPVNQTHEPGYFDAHVQNFHALFNRFKETVDDIRAGDITNKSHIDQELHLFWTAEMAEQADPAERPLKMIALGQELIGIIHDVYGKEALYNILNDLKTFPTLLNDAFDYLGLPYKL